jgi:prepilin-type N-terminal cleavage/methylation domain-containing protein
MKLMLLAKGFTLVELLIVITVVGVLAGGLAIAIDPAAKINLANIAKAETFSASLQNLLAFDLVGEWTFEDGTANDISGYGNNGTVTGAALVPDRKNRVNKAYSFNGTSGYINVTNGESLNITGDITIEAWIKPNLESTGRGGQIFQKHSWNNCGYRFQIAQRNGYVYFYTFQSGANQRTEASSAISYGQWNHVAVTRKGAIATIHVNGEDKTSIHANHVDPSSCGSTAFISTNWAAETFNGVIDDVRIYKSALLSSQIKQIYAQGLIEHQLAKFQ